MKIKKIKEYLDFDKHLDKNNNFSSLSQFRSSLFEIIDKARSKKKPDFLLYRLLRITNFKSIITPYSPLSKKLFIFIVNLFYSKDKKEYETLKCIIYKSFKVNTKYYGIEEDEASDLLASGYVNHINTDISSCLCTHNITYHYIIENDIEERAWVGSICIINFMGKYNQELTETVKILQLKALHRKDGKICKFCTEPLGSMKSGFPRKGYCSKICSIKYNYKLPFGKYKGVLLRNIMKDKKGKDYINYCKDKYMNDDSYEQYNTFIKIIFDRKTQLLRDKNFK